MKPYLLSIFTCLFIAFTSCKKFLEVPPPAASTSSSNVFADDATAISALTAVYAKISNLNATLSNSGLANLSLYCGLSADELTLFNLNDTRYQPFYTNGLSNISSSNIFWNTIYPYIYTANSAIEGLNSSSTLTPTVKKQLLGEAKFIRAFCFFYLTNLYGDVPLTTSSDFKVNSLLQRTPKTSVNDQIIKDLIDAQSLLSTTYLKPDGVSPYSTGSEQRVRPTKWAATALLARVYLYNSDWVKAEAQSSILLENNNLFSLPTIGNAFKMNSSETIWALQPVGTGTQSNTGDAAMFILPIAGPNANPNEVYLSNQLLASFEPGDMRRFNRNWIDSVKVGTITYYYPYKYKIAAVNVATTEYNIVFRLAEQFLIRAEARAQQNNISGALSDVNTLRTRASLPLLNSQSQSSIITLITHERQVELFTEWGHRWFDLKRTNSIDAVMTSASVLKGGSWNSFKSLYPIPLTELTANPNIVQNTGY